MELRKLQFLPVVILVTVGLIVAFAYIDNFAYANEHEIVTAEIYGNQTKVIIKNEFSTTTTKRDVIINEMVENFALTWDFANSTLVTQFHEDEGQVLRNRFEAKAEIRDCITDTLLNLEFILDTTDRNEIVDALVDITQLTKSKIGRSFKFKNYDVNEIDIRVTLTEDKSKFQISFCEDRARFSLNTIEEAEILVTISKMTGLEQSEIITRWIVEDTREQAKVEFAIGKNVTEIKEEAEKVLSQAEQQMAKVESSFEAVQEGGDVGGSCLIATAAFDSELAPQIQSLRETRDSIVMQTQSGKAFMNSFNQFYYSFSPTIADWERENPVFKSAVKATIFPLITSLSILNYLDIDSEIEMLGYGISIILLNIGMYFAVPAIFIIKIKKKFK
ncbi:MAG: hypothetical protein NPMRIOTA_160007 [Nitrosopumilales archaeon]|nr:MAG: hypothetical protein NPMRIOTA_160007 [Nitrosopumilales archaeon]